VSHLREVYEAESLEKVFWSRALLQTEEYKVLIRVDRKTAHSAVRFLALHISRQESYPLRYAGTVRLLSSVGKSKTSLRM
jgi:hypothetical protein